MTKSKRKYKNRKFTNRHPWSRYNRAEVYFNDGEFADLKLLAEAWGSTIPGVIWCLVGTWLQTELRERDIMRLPYSDSTRKILYAGRVLERRASGAQEQGKGDSDESWEKSGYSVRLRRDLPTDPEED